jgi:hypothetical protein
MILYRVQRVKDHHARRNRHLVVYRLAAIWAATIDAQSGFVDQGRIYFRF